MCGVYARIITNSMNNSIIIDIVHMMNIFNCEIVIHFLRGTYTSFTMLTHGTFCSANPLMLLAIGSSLHLPHLSCIVLFVLFVYDIKIS